MGDRLAEELTREELEDLSKGDIIDVSFTSLYAIIMIDYHTI